MLERLFAGTAIPVLEQAAQFTAARHRAILSNIANADTPGYRARDLDEAAFREQLREAAEAQAQRPAEGFRLSSSSNVSTRSDGHTVFETIPSPDAGPPGPDGNNVDIEREVIALIRNTLQHKTALELLRKQFALIETAIRERV